MSRLRRHTTSRFSIAAAVCTAAVVPIAVASAGVVAADATFSQQVIPAPAGSQSFGSSTLVLDNGNYVIGDPFWDAPGGPADVGAVRLYDGSTNEVIATLRGSDAGDTVGALGIREVGGSNFVVLSNGWNDGRGALTWVDGDTGLNGTVGAANSLVGSNPGDSVGVAVVVLADGDYVTHSLQWNDTRGAATFGRASAPLTGTVSSANSLVGTSPADFVGQFVTPLTNGNYVVESPNWDGVADDGGAATFGEGAGGGVTGPVSTTNSLYGTTEDARVGSSVAALTNGNYVVATSRWSDGATDDLGAATLGDGAAGTSGAVTAANSLVGSVEDDGDTLSVTPLSNGNAVVQWSSWSNDRGAVTWIDGGVGRTGAVTPANSFVGTAVDDRVGRRVIALSNGNYVVLSQAWNDERGAATWADGTAVLTGSPSAANSLIGSSPNEQIGSTGVALANGNYVVGSPDWDAPGALKAGIVTVGNGSGGTTGTIDAAASLLGGTAADRIGSGGVYPLTNGNAVVASPAWSANDAGAVTWIDGTGTTTGVVSVANSLVGSSADDAVGSIEVTALPNGDYVVSSPFWDGAAANTGAITWGDGEAGVRGTISSTNSLVGSSADDTLGWSGACGVLPIHSLVTPIDGTGAWTVFSTRFDQDGTNAGAVTIWPAGQPTAGTVGAGNSLTGDPGISNPAQIVDRDSRGLGCTQRNVVTVKTTASGAILAGGPNRAFLGTVPGVMVQDIISLDPARLLETRSGADFATIDGRFEGDGRIGADDEIEVEIAGRGGVAPDATAAVLNVTAIRPLQRGFLTIHPCDDERPLASSLNYANAGGVVANEVVVKLSARGTVCIYSPRATHLVADVTGYVPNGSPVNSITPERLLETRSGPTFRTVDRQFEGDGQIGGGQQIEVPIAGRGSIAANATAVIMNVTAIRPVDRGFFTIHPCDELPLASSLNYTDAGTIIGNEVVVRLSDEGSICIFSRSSTHLTVDVTGFITDAAGTVSLAPRRFTETRSGPNSTTIDGEFEGDGRILAGQEIEVQITGRPGVPDDGVAAVVMNVTAVRPSARGFITIHPCQEPRPLASSLNYETAGSVAGNEVIAKLSERGTVCVYTLSETHLTIDVTGWIPEVDC